MTSLYNENFHPVFLSKSRLKTILFIQTISQNFKRFVLDDVLRWTKNRTLKKVLHAKMLLKNTRKLFKSSFFRTTFTAERRRNIETSWSEMADDKSRKQIKWTDNRIIATVRQCLKQRLRINPGAAGLDLNCKVACKHFLDQWKAKLKMLLTLENGFSSVNILTK